MHRRSLLLLILILLVALTSTVFANTDIEGGKDHSIFTRMPNYFIIDYVEKDYDQYRFFAGGDQYETVEGKFYYIHYRIKEGLKFPSSLQIVRNYTNAARSGGGRVLSNNDHEAVIKFAKGTDETWVHVYSTDDGMFYSLTIVEKKGMDQDVVADAASMLKGLNNTGKVALYGIYFDTGKSDLKPQSDAALAEIAKLMKGNARLKLYVVGHTDNVGRIEANMKLSDDRAKAVVKALTSKYGIDQARLTGYGMGPLAPVASNRTEEGRALNRRVELVEQ